MSLPPGTCILTFITREPVKGSWLLHSEVGTGITMPIGKRMRCGQGALGDFMN